MAVTTTAAAACPLVRESFVDSRLGQIHVWQFTPASGTSNTRTPVLLIHQTSLSAREYLPLALSMSGDRTVYALDLPGYGASNPLSAPVAIDDYAAAVEDAIDLLVSGSATATLDLVGTHGGSLIASQVALDRPRQIRRLVLAGVALETTDEQQERLRTLVRDVPFDTTMSRMQVGLSKLTAEASDPVDRERRALLILDSLRAYDRRWYLFDSSARYPGMQRLPLLTQPTLILAFDDDLRAATLRAVTLIPVASLIDMAPVGSLPYYRATARTTETMRTFLDR